MLKKTISALFVAFLMIIGASAAGAIFPAQRTDVDGVTRYGYLDEEGRTALPFAYTSGRASLPNAVWRRSRTTSGRPR